MVRKLGALLVAIGALGLVAISAAPAGAQCRGQLVRYEPAEIARGERVLIAGEGWGDDCYDDDRALPPGQGVLGAPIRKISITLVQGDRRIVVAKGAANSSYRFAVWVPVPTSLDPGGVNVVATWHRAASDGGAIDFMTDQFRITDAPPTNGTAKVKVVRFGK